MSNHDFKQYDFEHPSILFILEDKLRTLFGGPVLYNAYFNTFGLKGNERVLDFGCGGGAGSRCLANLLSKDGHLTCVDVSRYWIDEASKRLEKFSNAECRSGDIRELRIPDSSFDVISVIHVIHDIAPEDRQDIIKTLSLKLKAGGFFFIREPTKRSHGLPAEEIRSLLSGAGLRETARKESRSEYTAKYQKYG